MHHPDAGKLIPKNQILSLSKLMDAYHSYKPNAEDSAQRVCFGTSGHRGTPFDGSFNIEHILAISQAICDFRVLRGIKGPLFLGMDTHALSEVAFVNIIEVLTANKIDVFYEKDCSYTPTPAVSYAIINFNRNHQKKADGIVITPSHNPPEYGGIKYNMPHGGPAENSVTNWISQRANCIMEKGAHRVNRIPFSHALQNEAANPYDYMVPYVEALDKSLQMKAVKHSGVRIGVDPMGGAGVYYWGHIAYAYGLDIDIINTGIDKTFSFVPRDVDGKIRMDCSSPYAMKPLIALQNDYDLAIGNDPDFDRHGIVTKNHGLMVPNHYLSVCADYLFRMRKDWKSTSCLGKTVVTTALLDRIATDVNRTTFDTPVGFKWFQQGLTDGQIGMACEESAGLAFLRKDGTVWTTDKDGITAGLLGAEIMAVTGNTLEAYYKRLTDRFGESFYRRRQIGIKKQEQEGGMLNMYAGITQKSVFANEEVLERYFVAPGNGQDIGGVKLVTKNGWLSIRSSGTEPVCKVYMESFQSEEHLDRLEEESIELLKKVALQ